MKNDLIYEQERTVSSIFIDSQLKLSTAQTVSMIQDNLTECFNMMKCDGIIYKELGYFWVFTKSRIKFIEPAKWRENVIVKTFPINNAGFRTNINTEISTKDGKIVALANQEACVLDLEKHRPAKLTNLPFPKENFPESVYNEAFERFNINIEDCSEIFTHIIRSQQIDMSHHLNNLEYIKLGMNTFTTEYLEAHMVDTLEVHYTGESKENQELHILKCDKPEGSYILITESNRIVFEMKITFKE